MKLKMDQRAERLEISHDMILRELAKIAFSNMGNYYDERGDLRPMCELSERDKAAIFQFEVVDIAEPDGYKVGKITKIKLHNKMSALDKIARHLGFYGVAGKTQESRGKNQEEAGETQESRGKNQEEVFLEETQESRGKNQEEELGGMVEAVDLTVLDEGKDLVLEDVKESGGKILTFSPLLDKELDDYIALTEKASTRETVATAIYG